jgi:hypothetical protein
VLGGFRGHDCASPTDYSPVKQMQLRRFDGARWVGFGGIVNG